jgi:hypothetical protein
MSRPSSASTSSISKILTSFSKPLFRLNLLHRRFSTAPLRMPKTFKVAKVSDLKDGQMKEVEIPGTDGKVLLSRVKGNIYATGNKCTRTSHILH